MRAEGSCDQKVIYCPKIQPKKIKTVVIFFFLLYHLPLATA